MHSMAELGKITMEFAESRANQKEVFMEFQPIDIQMKALVERYTKPWCLQCSEYTFTNLFMWGQGEGIRVAEYNGALFIAASWENSPFMFAPLTENPEGDYAAALADAVAYFRKIGAEPSFRAICGPIKAAFERCSGFVLEEDRDNSDYVYSMESLLTLSGKKLHGKRNHINQFRAQYGDVAEYVEITPDMLGECMGVYCEWLSGKDASEPGVLSEKEAIQRILTHMDTLGVKGGGIRIQGKLAAFTLGEQINDEIAVIHIEKADSGIPGLYTIINQQFVEHAWTKVKYINREEDMGLEGLRRAKLSYNPAFMIDKFHGRLA